MFESIESFSWRDNLRATSELLRCWGDRNEGWKSARPLKVAQKLERRDYGTTE